MIDAVSAGGGRSLVQQMVLDVPRVTRGVMAITRAWLGLDELRTKMKDNGLLPDLLRNSMMDEAPTLAAHVFSFGHGDLASLLTTDYTFVDPILAQHYGMSAVSGDFAIKAPFGTPDRVGILGTASILTLAADAKNPPFPTRRFKYLATTLFCEREAGAPFAQIGFPPDPTKGMRRHVTDMTTVNDSCKSCHEFVNPVSFAFLKFDSVGRLQQQDVDGAIDSTGSVPNGPAPAQVVFPQALLGLSFTGQPDLMQQIATMPAVQTCVVRHWLAHGYRRPYLDTTLDAQVAAIGQRFIASRGDLTALVIDIGTELLHGASQGTVAR